MEDEEDRLILEMEEKQRGAMNSEDTRWMIDGNGKGLRVRGGRSLAIDKWAQGNSHRVAYLASF